MKFSDYTPKQQEAITKDGSSILVSAGAGSGKTQVLTQRVVYFIKEKGYKLSDFLIVTFTEAAASEMKERIRKALTQVGSEEANYVDVADICTFDAYALKIVKKNHFLINKSKDISIVDSKIIAVRKRTILDEIFEKIYESHDSVFEEIIARFCFKDDVDIKNLILKLYDNATKQINTQDYLDTFEEKYFASNIADEVINYNYKNIITLITQVFSYVTFLPAVPLKKTDPRLFNEVTIEFLKPLLDAKTYDDIISNFPGDFPYTKPSNLGQDGQVIDEFKVAYKDLKTAIEKAPKNKNEVQLEFSKYKEFAATFIDLANLLHEKIMAYKEYYQVFEFNDIAKFALELVTNNEDIKNSLKKELKMIMIDEYQDTSLIQEAFINEIADDNVFYVGDIKQSIYRFRDAKCEIFAEKYDQYKSGFGGYAIDLNTNFRSRKEVLEDINFIFKQIMTKDCGGADYKTDHMILFGNKDYDNQGYTGADHHLEILTYGKVKSAESFKCESELIIQDIIDKINLGYLVFDRELNNVRPCTFKDFCIIIDRGTSFDDYAKAFNKYQIPLYIEADEDIKSNELILVIKNLLSLMVSIRNNDYSSSSFIHSFLSVSRSFIYQLSDNDLYQLSKNDNYKESKVVSDIKSIMYQYSYLPDSELFSQMLLELDIYHQLIHIGHVDKYSSILDVLASYFKEMAKLDYSLEDFVLFLDDISEYNLKFTIKTSGSDINSVHLMNIHKSKGLEYNIIYYPGLDVGFNRNDVKDKFNVSDKYGLVLPSLTTDKNSLLQDLNAEEEIKEDVSEKVRLLYVALTRAKEKIILVMKSDNQDQNLDNAYENYLNKLIKEKNIVSASNFDKLNLVKSAFINDFINKNDFIYYINKLDFSVTNLDELSVDDLKHLSDGDFHSINNLENLIDAKYDQSIHYACLGMKAYLKNDIIKKVVSKFLDLIGVTIDESFYLMDKDDQIIDDKLKNYIVKCKYDDSILEESFRNNLLQCYSNNEIVDFDSLLIFRFFYNEFPFEKYFRQIFKSIIDRKMDVKSLSLVLSCMGYNYNLSDDEGMNIDNSLMDQNIIQVKISLNDLFSPSKTIFKDWFENHDNTYYIVEKIYKLYLDDLIDKDCLNSVLNLFELEISPSYKDLKSKLDVEDFIKIINPKGEIIDVSNGECFYDFLETILESQYFAERTIIEHQKLVIKLQKIDYDEFKICELNYEPKKIEVFHASKKLKIESNNSNMDYGTRLHFIMESIDFINPNFDGLNDKEKKIVTDFLSSSIMSNLSKGLIYKEFEFYDDEKKINGIIDLMVVYDDHIDIIDYKTKNIDDEGYDRQVNIYANYVERKFKKPVNKYLYSLLTGDYRKLK